MPETEYDDRQERARRRANGDYEQGVYGDPGREPPVGLREGVIDTSTPGRAEAIAPSAIERALAREPEPDRLGMDWRTTPPPPLRTDPATKDVGGTKPPVISPTGTGMGSALDQLAAQYGYGGSTPTGSWDTRPLDQPSQVAIPAGPDGIRPMPPITETVPPGSTPPGTTGTRDPNSIINRLLAESGRDIGWLRGEPFTSTEEQAMRERARSASRTGYDAARQRAREELGARQGFSGVLADELGTIDREEAQRMNEINRDIFLQGTGEMRGRRAESRGILSGLEALERTRQAEAMGIEAALSETERQGLRDLMAALGMAPSTGEAANVSGNLLNYASNLGRTAQGNLQSQYGNLSDIGQLYYLMSRQPTT